jgi:hypothetical protein
MLMMFQLTRIGLQALLRRARSRSEVKSEGSTMRMTRWRELWQCELRLAAAGGRGSVDSGGKRWTLADCDPKDPFFRTRVGFSYWSGM